MTRKLDPDRDLITAAADNIQVGETYALRDTYVPPDEKAKPHVRPRKVTVHEIVNLPGDHGRGVEVEAHEYVAHVPESWARARLPGVVNRLDHAAIPAGETRIVPAPMIGPPWSHIVPYLNYERQIPKRRNRAVDRFVAEGLCDTRGDDLGGVTVSIAALGALLDEVEHLRPLAARVDELAAEAERIPEGGGVSKSPDLSDYVEVADRIVEFREKYPDGSLQPAYPDRPYEIVQPNGETYIVVTAAAYRSADDQRPGIGMAWEPFPGRTPYTKGSELQNAETSAWGRAIVAALAADTKRGVASANEVRNRQDEQAARPQTGPGEISEKQARMIRALRKKLKAERATKFNEWTRGEFGDSDETTWTKQQASRAIEALQAETKGGA